MLEGIHALISGGSGGIGMAAARALAGVGASLTLLGRSSEALTTAAARLVTEIDADILTVVCDVTRPEDVARAVFHAVETMGPVRIMVHAAAPPVQDMSGSFLDMTSERWHKVWQTRVSGAQSLIRHMMDGGHHADRRHIIMVGSTMVSGGYDQRSAEGVAEHALHGLVRNLAVEWRQKPVSINYLALGQVTTEALNTEIEQLAARSRRPASAIAEEFARANPDGALIDPDAVGRALLWLCDPANTSFSGQIMGLTGGAVL